MPSRRTAIAFALKSRFARSSSIEPPWSGDTSPTNPASAITRHAPNSSDSGNAGPPAAAATARATLSGSSRVTQVDVRDRAAEDRVAHRTANQPHRVRALAERFPHEPHRARFMEPLPDVAHACPWTRRTRGVSPQVIS